MGSNFEVKSWLLNARSRMFEPGAWKYTRRVLLTAIIYLLASVGFTQTLDDYFKTAANNNPGLQAKYLSFEAAMQRVQQLGGMPDPNLSFGYFILPVETRVGPQRARISLTQMFPWFGTLGAQEDAARFIAEGKYQEFLDARNKLYFQVAATYYQLYELRRLISIEEENKRVLSSYKEIATSKFQNGRGSMVDALRVDIMLNESTTNLNILNQKYLPLATRFNNTLNRDENESIVVQDSLFITKGLDPGQGDSMLVLNPQIEELNLKVQASEAQERASIRQGLPKIGVGLDYVIIGERKDMDLEGNGRDALMPMISVSLPIYRAKFNAASKEAQLMREAYSLQREEVTNTLSSAFEMKSFEIRTQAELVALYDEQIKSSRQSLRLLYTAYSNSEKDFEEVLRMQQQILKYQKMKATALAQYHTAMAELDYITAKLK